LSILDALVLRQGLLVNFLERIAIPEEPYIPEAFNFTLSNDAILEFDKVHPPPGREPVPAFIQVAYDVLLFFVDRVYEGKAIERFWFLETVCPLVTLMAFNPFLGPSSLVVCSSMACRNV
jgi:hypothetical protein